MPKVNSSGRARAVSTGKPPKKALPIVDFVINRSDLATQASKATKDVQDGVRRTSILAPNNIGGGYVSPEFMRISRGITDKIRDADIVKQLLPDTAQAISILSASIQAPNTMIGCELGFEGDGNLVNPECNSEMVQAVKEYFDTEYPINDQIPLACAEMLGRSGAYVVAAVPESSIDDLINSSTGVGMESYNDEKITTLANYLTPKALGYLGERASSTVKTPKLAMEALLGKTTSVATYSGIKATPDFIESIKKDPWVKPFGEDKLTLENFHFSITDNPEILKAPILTDRLREQSIERMRERDKTVNTFTMEDDPLFKEVVGDLRGMTNDQIESLVYKTPRPDTKPVVMMKSQHQLNRRTIGAATIIRIKTDAVMNVYEPGNKAKQLAHLVLLDPFGYPIDTDETLSQYEQLINNSHMQVNNQGGSQNYAMGQNARADNLVNGVNPTNFGMYNQRQKEYQDLVVAQWNDYFRNGLYPTGVEFDNTPAFYQVMMARALCAKKTTILFLPADMVTYMAFDYDNNGTGKSLLDDSRILHSQRIQVAVANVMASIRNSVGLTNVTVQLDDDLADPRKSIAAIAEYVMGGRQNLMPDGIMNPTDIAYWASRAGLRFSFEGSAAIPNTKIDYQETSTQHVKPDTEYEASLQRKSHASLKVPTELIDNAYGGPEFAISVAQNNLIFSRVVREYQAKLTRLFSTHCQQVIRADQPLHKKLKLIVLKHYKTLKPEFTNEEKNHLKLLASDRVKLAKFVVEKVTKQWVDNLKTTLPAPDNTVISAQVQMLSDYETFVDAAMKAYINPEVFSPEMVGSTLSGGVDMYIAILKAHAMRDFAASKNILPELQGMFITDNSLKMLALVESEAFVDKASKEFLLFLKRRTIMSKAYQDAAEKIQVEAPESTSSSGTGEDTTGGADGGEDDLFGGDLGGLEDPAATEGGEDKPADDTAAATEDKPADTGDATGDKPASAPEAAPEA